MKARMRSIYDALDLIKQKAQDTALTYNSIINLCLTDKRDRLFKVCVIIVVEVKDIMG